MRAHAKRGYVRLGDVKGPLPRRAQLALAGRGRDGVLFTGDDCVSIALRVFRPCGPEHGSLAGTIQRRGDRRLIRRRARGDSTR